MLDALHLEQSGVPIYVQIREQLLRAIGAGVLKPGEQMPTMRQVAVALRVDLNTVRRAYEALAQLGVIAIVPARGTFVARQPMVPIDRAATERLEDFALRTIASARAAGLDPGAVAHRIIALQERKDDPL